MEQDVETGEQEYEVGHADTLGECRHHQHRLRLDSEIACFIRLGVPLLDGTVGRQGRKAGASQLPLPEERIRSFSRIAE
jgi:hypothetical protein